MIKGIGALTALQHMAVAPLFSQQPERLFPERPTGPVSDVAGIIRRRSRLGWKRGLAGCAIRLAAR
jgi:hypothetical protein